MLKLYNRFISAYDFAAGKVAGLSGIGRWVITVLAGVLAAAALPPLGVWPAFIIAVTVFVAVLDGIHTQPVSIAKRRRLAFVGGWAFGFGYFGVSLYWIGEAFLVDAGTFAWMLPFAVTAMPAGLALFWGLASVLAVSCWSQGPGRIFVLAASFAGLEWLRGHVLTGFPWNAPAYAADAILPLAQAASVVGLYGLCFLVMLWAAAPVLLSSAIARGWLVAIAASVLIVIAFGSWRLQTAKQVFHPDVRLRIVQPNVAQKEKWQPENRRWIYQRYLEMTQAPAGVAAPNIIVWPESALPVWLDEDEGTRRQIAQVAGPDAVVIAGAIRRKPIGGKAQRGHAFNSVLALDSAGAVAARYDKQILVPFGEYLPLARWLEPLGLRKLVAMPSGFAAGPGPVTLRIAGVPPFAPLICYEAIFPRAMIDQTDRPQWLLNVTNDAWFGQSVGPHQHLAQARLRAIEEGLPLVRAANTGISAVFDPLGRVLHSLPLGQRGSIDTELPLPVKRTAYSKYGDWLLFCLIAIVALGRVRTYLWNSD